MVHRVKNLLAPPAGLTDARWNTLKANLLVDMHHHTAKTECYRDTTLEALTNLYKNKCAICERDRGFELEVDHYRPKKTRNNQTGQQYNQPGYYWLCYEWSNLLPLCSKCNGNKSNKFPLTGWNEVNRISSHLNLQAAASYQPYDSTWLHNYEHPLLLNPELETIPARHFSYHKNGKIIGRTSEGIETINICKLNRKDLTRERLKVKRDYIAGIKSALDDFATTRDQDGLRGELKMIFKQLKLRCHSDEYFSLYHVYIYRYFDYFIGTGFNQSLRQIINRYFNDFKATYGI